MEHKKNALAVASGIHIAEYDKAIGSCVLLGLLFFPLAPATGLIGFPLLALAIWGRHLELNR